MKLINKIITTAVLPLAMAGMMASCEDACTNCSCDNFKITSIVSGDSLQQLNELYSDQVVVIKGVGLSSVHDVYLVDSTGAQYSVELNPTFVTDNNIVITMSSDAALVSTEKVLVVSNYGCRNEYAIKKPVSAPSIKLFYCEFVPDGDTLRVYGNAFLNNPEMKDTLKVWFQSMDGATIVKADSFVIDHDNTELRIKVPVGVADNSYLYVQNNHGVSVSPMLFRDTRNIFLDFDEEIASNLRGSMDTFNLDWDPAIKAHDEDMYNSILKDALGNAFPKGCNGYYTALTWSKAWSYNDGSNQIYLTPHSSHPEAPQKNLLGQFVTMPLNNLCLKFEVYIPEKLPWWSHAYFVFTAYGTEDENDPSFTDNAYGEDAKHGFLARDLTSNGDEGIDWEYLEDGNQFICKFPENKYGVPAAWFHMGVYNVVEDGGSATGVSGYSTKHGWMTVCVPLNDNYFRYPVSDRGIATSDVYKACGTLRNDIDFFNFYMNIDDDKDFQKKAKTGFDNYMFLAVDNFRIVPEDNGGARFSKYSGVTPGSAYPY